MRPSALPRKAIRRRSSRYLRPATTAFGVTLLIFNLTSCIGGAVAAIGAFSGGVATKLLLQDMDDRATHVVQNAAASGSLVSSKAARDVQLLIDATRQNLHDELDTQWDKLDNEKIGLLRELNSQVDRIQDISGDFGRLEDTAYLDTDTLVSRLPFAEKMPRVRKVEGSSQYYKTDGDYQVRITSNVFEPFGPDTQVFIGDTRLTVAEKPPYSAVLTIPNKMLHFRDYQTSDIPLTIKTRIEQKSWFSKTKKDYVFTVPIELFAKNPAYYQMDESINAEVPDLTKVTVSKGPLMTIPGCGDSGCNAYYNVCTPFPIGAVYTRTLNLYDSFSGWGGFGAVTVGTGTVCQVYWQHSHNVARNVSIDVEYHPLKPEVQHSPIVLKPVVAGKAPDALCTTGIDGSNPTPDKPTAPVAVGTSNTVCWLQFGKSYLADFNPNTKGYTLAVHMFNGQNYYVVDGVTDKTHPGIELQSLPLSDTKKAVFKILEPVW